MLLFGRRFFLVVMLVGALGGPVLGACPVGDVYQDCRVDWQDLKFLADRWLAPGGSDADIVGGDGVNFGDYAEMMRHWGQVGSGTGVLAVTILPAAAADEGAQWRVDGGIWRDSGTAELSVGLHSVDYRPVIGWISPSSETVHVLEGQTVSAEGNYVQEVGAIRVRLYPEGAVTLGARWRLAGGTWRESDYTEPNLPVGLYSIEFGSIDGWAEPNGVDVDVSNGLIMAVEATYKHPLVINEFLASNSGNATDPQNQDDDWIELYNRGESAIDVGGMYMTDEPGSPMKWMIPDDNPSLTTIVSGGYLVIWADGDVQDYPAGLHAGFELDDRGDDICLYDSDGLIRIDKIAFGDQDSNISYGRFPDGNDTWQFMALPTIGSENVVVYSGFVGDVKFSHDRGFYEDDFLLTIACGTEGSEIYYSTDGSEPGVVDGEGRTGLHYDGTPVLIDKTTCVRARAVKTGWKDSAVDTQTYIFVDDVINQSGSPAGFPSTWGPTAADYAMNSVIVNDNLSSIDGDLKSLPTMSLVMEMDDLFGAANGIYANPTMEGVGWERPGSVEFFYPDDSDGFQVNCGVRIYGGVGRDPQFRKKTFRFLFKGIYGPTKLHYRLFGDDAVDEFDTIIVRANFNDGYPWGGSNSQYIRDEWMRRAQQATGHPSATGTFVHLYINGLYWGLYNPVQRPDMSFSASYYPGDKDEWDGINSTRSIGGSPREGWNTLMSMCSSELITDEAYQRLQGNDPDGTNNPLYQDYLDVDQYINFLLVNYYGGNNDWISHNWYAGARRGPESTGWKAYTWDAEWVMGIGSGVDENSTTDTTTQDFLLKPYTYLRNNTEFQMRFGDYAHRAFFNGGQFYVDGSNPSWNPNHPEWNRPAASYSALADSIERAMICETARWGDTGGGNITIAQWRGARDWILDSYMPVRSQKTLDHLRGAGLYPSISAPVFRINGTYQHGGHIRSTDSFSMTDAGGTIYYTTDGSDPRMPTHSDLTRTVLVSRGMRKFATVPTGPVNDNWRGGGYFDLSGWQVIEGSPGGVGYDESSDYIPFISWNVNSLMNGDVNGGANTTAMVRIPFTIGPGVLSGANFLTLKVQYDDGFVAFINGQFVQGANYYTDDPAWDESSNGGHEAGGSFTTFDIFSHIGKLHEGENILAVQGLNIGTGSSDFVINAEMEVGSIVSYPAGVSPSAAVYYNGAMTFEKSTQVRSRALNGDIWSALNEATYSVGPVAESVRISEIMYHPQDTGDPNDPNEEFIELKNIGVETINLNLVEFTNGINFTFGDIELDPCEYVLVVKDEGAFLSAHGSFSGVIAGEYDGSLDNGGERVELQDAAGQTIHDFRYADGWRSITDGAGYSLTVIDPTNSVSEATDEGLVGHWKLDDASGAVTADSAGSNDGVLYGVPDWTAGRIAGALDFDGCFDYILLSPIEALGGEDVTVGAWVCLENYASFWNPVVTQYDHLGYGYYFYIYEDKPGVSLVDGGGIAQIWSSEKISRGQWHHFAGTNDGEHLRMYVDGELKGSISSAGLTGTSANAYIGYDASSPAYFFGRIDDVRVYNRALAEYEFEHMRDPLERWGRKSAWRASAYAGGSPGFDDSGIIPDPGSIVISEILAHSHSTESDWIELYNTTGSAINIGGWYLSDSPVDLQKYRFAEDTEIGAYSYLVLREDANFGEMSGDAGKVTGFAFSENGDEAYLSSGQSGVLTGYRDAESFGASYTGVSFGRYYKRSTNSYNFVPMDHNTPWARNAYPAVGPIVISEIMYNPDWPSGGMYDNDKYEYIELHNITSSPAKLWREDKALPWKFSAGVDFVFPDWPDEVEIPAGGRIVVVKDPNAFMWRYPDIPEEKIFGPFSGNLDDGGERVEISMPGDIDKFGRQYYIRIDRVTYSDGSHPDDVAGEADLWPVEADAGGKSLFRRIGSQYGNDPNNWLAAEPSPGV